MLYFMNYAVSIYIFPCHLEIYKAGVNIGTELDCSMSCHSEGFSPKNLFWSNFEIDSYLNLWGKKILPLPSGEGWGEGVI